jgi:hydrogenase maturation protease
MNTLIFGMGNPYRGDDGVGIKIARELKKNFKTIKNLLDIQSGDIGAFSLLESSKEYDHLVVIDAEETSDGRPGEVKFMKLDDFEIKHSSTSHYIDLRTAWSLWQKNFKKPKSVDIFAIRIKEQTDYNDSLSPELERKLPGIIKTISQKLKLSPKNSYSS